MQIRGIRGKKNVVGKITFPYIILTIIAFLLCLRCFYSFCWSDESFYLSLVHRFWLGDRPIIDEWSGIQFYSLVLLPIYGFYMKIIGNNEGIYLFFRLLIVISNYFLSIYIYKSLKGSTHEIPALIGALIYLLYTRANILGASYYSVALLFFTWTVFLLFNYNRNETNNIRMFTIGCTMAVTVLSLPYLAVVYILTIGFVVCLSPFQRYRKCLLVTIMGTGFCAIIYLGFLSTRISLSELTMFIPYLFEDVEHQSMNPVLSIVVWFGRIVNRYKYTIAISIISILYLCLKKIQHKTIEWKSTKIIIIINLMLTVVNILFSYNVIGCSNIAIAIFSIICFLGVESNDMISKKIFKEVYFPGVVFSIIFHMASNTGLDAITIGFVPREPQCPALPEVPPPPRSPFPAGRIPSMPDAPRRIPPFPVFVNPRRTVPAVDAPGGKYYPPPSGGQSVSPPSVPRSPVRSASPLPNGRADNPAWPDSRNRCPSLRTAGAGHRRRRAAAPSPGVPAAPYAPAWR